MDDRDFVDLIYTGFTNTTRAADTFWMPEKNEERLYVGWFETEPYINSWSVYAVDQEKSKTLVGVFTNEVDADFVTAVHGCFPDLVRRLHAALDEADRLDVERDEAEQKSFALAMEVEELRNSLATARAENSYHRPLG